MSASDNVNWDAVAAARSSGRRKQTIEALQEGPKYAGEIADDLGTSRGTISNHLHWLKSEDLAECITPDRPHHRLYALTEAGTTVAEHV